MTRRGSASPMHVTQEGPDALSLYCLVQASGFGGIDVCCRELKNYMPKDHVFPWCRVVGGVDTHKDLHVAAIVDENDRLLTSECSASTRHGYKKMLAWMRSFGELDRIGIECTDTYLAAELIGLVGFAFAEAFRLGRMELVNLLAAFALLLPDARSGLLQRHGEGFLKRCAAPYLTLDIPDHPAKPLVEKMQFCIAAVELSGMAIATMHDKRLLANP